MPDIEREDACTCGTLCATHWATCPLGEPLDGGAVMPDIERSSADWYARRAAKWEETAGVMRARAEKAEAEVARLREANEHLLALENGDWRARYSDASREVDRLRERALSDDEIVTLRLAYDGNMDAIERFHPIMERLSEALNA